MAVSTRGKSQASAGVKGSGIDSVTNWQRGDHFAAVGIHDRHLLVVTAGKQPPVLAIYGQSTRLLAGRQRPARFHRQFARVNGDDLTLIFDVYEDSALLIADSELWSALELNGSDHGGVG